MKTKQYSIALALCIVLSTNLALETQAYPDTPLCIFGISALVSGGVLTSPALFCVFI